MVAFALIFWGIVFATLVPAYIALYLIPALKVIPLRYLAAAGVGLTIWFFFDTMGDAASLDENFSVYPPSTFVWPSHFLLILAFVAGVTVLGILDRLAVGPGAGPAGRTEGGWNWTKGSLFLIPAAVAFVMGIHGLAEGWNASSAVAAVPIASGSPIQALVQAFGDLPAVVSYPIHKFLEASIIAIAYTAYVAWAGGGAAKRIWHVPALGLLFAGPSIIGATLGYFFAFDTTYFYAFGVTAALYALLRLVEPIAPEFQEGTRRPIYLGGKVFLSLAVGFFLLYAAALLH